MSSPPSAAQEPAELVDLGRLRPNEANPRTIRDARFKKLVASVKELPQMLGLRPIVIRSWDDPTIVGGNQRYQALLAAGYTEVPVAWVRTADGFTAEELRRFVVADNVGFGTFDEVLLGQHYTDIELTDWGLEHLVVPPLTSDQLDELFGEKGPGAPSSGKKIVLEFSEGDYGRVIAAIKDRKATAEAIMLEALGLL